MALLSYGSTLGLAYVHDFKGYNDEMARQEQMTAAKKAQDTQKSMWVADKLKLGKTFTKYDSDELKKFALERYEKVGKIVNSNEWETNPMALALINQNSEELLDNEHVQRSSRVHQAQQMLVKDLSDPKYADDEDAAQLMKLKLQEFSNYDKQGNGDGVEGAPVKEFSYTSPSLVDINDVLNDQSKFLGKREEGWMTSQAHGTAERFVNGRALAESILSGPHRKKFDRAYENYIKATGSEISKAAWVQKSLEERSSLSSTFSLNPVKSEGDGSKSDIGSVLDLFQEYVPGQVYKAMDAVKLGTSPYQKSKITGATSLIAGGVTKAGDGLYDYGVDARNGFMIMRADGKLHSISDLNGKNMKIRESSNLVTINVGGKIETFVEATAIVPKDESMQLQNLAKYGSKIKGQEGYEEGDNQKWMDQGGITVRKNKDDQEFMEITTLLPFEASDESKFRYNSEIMGKDEATKTKRAQNELRNFMFQLDRNLKEGQSYVEPSSGIKFKKEKGQIKRVN